MTVNARKKKLPNVLVMIGIVDDKRRRLYGAADYINRTFEVTVILPYNIVER